MPKVAFVSKASSCPVLPDPCTINNQCGPDQTGADAYDAFAFFKYIHRYLGEAMYRFNRRFSVAAMVPRLLVTSARCTPSHWMRFHWPEYRNARTIAWLSP